jgi:hypothetical protein
MSRFLVWDGTKEFEIESDEPLAPLSILAVDENMKPVGRKVQTRFVLTRRDFRGPIVIRFGSSTKVWDLYIRDGESWHLQLQSDPLKGETAGTVVKGEDKVTDTDGKTTDVFDLKRGQSVDLKPGSKLNPTKETPAALEVVDAGTAQALAVDKATRKYDFSGESLKGGYFFRAEDEKEPGGFWLMSRSSGPETKEQDAMKEIKVLVDDDQLDETEDEKARGEGQGQGGPRQGDAGADYCYCETCDKLVKHDRGKPCNETDCPDCSKPMRGATEEEVAASKARGQGQGVGGPRQGDSGADVCVCPKCGREFPHEKGKPCNERKCPDCNVALVGKSEQEGAGMQTERTLVTQTATGLGQQVKAEDEKAGRRIRRDKLDLLEKLKSEWSDFRDAFEKAWDEVISWGKYKDEKPENIFDAWLAGRDVKEFADSLKERNCAAFAFKAADGQYWWMQWTTNAFKDREEETFTTKALEEFVDRHDDDDVKGEFWFWHIPGTKFADVKWRAMSGRFLVEAGPFDKSEVGQTFQKFFLENPNGHSDFAQQGWGTSHGYLYDAKDREDGVYNWLEIKESTVLPFHVASNQFSPSPMILEVKMNEAQKDALRTIGGDKADRLLELVETLGAQRTKELEEAGVDFKAADFAKQIRATLSDIDDETVRAQVEKIAAQVGDSYPAPKKARQDDEEDEEKKKKPDEEEDEEKKKKPKDEEEEEGKKAAGNLAKLAKTLQMLSGKAGKAKSKLAKIADAMLAAGGAKADDEECDEYPKPKKKKEAEDELSVEDVAQAIGMSYKALDDRMAAVLDAVGMLAEHVKAVSDDVEALKRDDATKIAEKAAATPAASLFSLVQSAIGAKETQVDGRSSLAKSGPDETPVPEQAVTGIPFVDAFITNADQRKA